jgi:hypothetical protein
MTTPIMILWGLFVLITVIFGITLTKKRGDLQVICGIGVLAISMTLIFSIKDATKKETSKTIIRSQNDSTIIIYHVIIDSISTTDTLHINKKTKIWKQY